MPASRPIWKGQLRLSLVSIPIELYTATKSDAKPSFRQIHRPTGKPINYEKVVAGVGPVDKDDIMKGFEYEKGDYVLLTDDEIDAVRLETRKTLELTQFVDADDIEPIYYDKPYFVVPADDLAEDAFRVIRDALRQTNKVGLGQLALRGKEHLVAIKPTGRGILLETLHYQDEIRRPEPYFAEVSAQEADPELLDVAKALIARKSAKFNAGAFKDHYQSALRELIAKKLKSKGKKVVTELEEAPRPTGSNVVDLMAALKKSLEGGDNGNAAPAKSATAKSSSPKASATKAEKPAPGKAAAAKPRASSPRKKAG